MPQSRNWLRPLTWLLCCALLGATLPGCSLFVMAGKMLMGDPKQEAGFKTRTGVDLMKGEKELLVICRTPYSVASEMPSLQHDLNTGVLKCLRQHHVKTVAPDKVADWLDDNGGEIRTPQRLVKDFDCDYIAIVEVNGLTFREEGSRDMFRGNASGTIRVFEVQKSKDSKQRDVIEVYGGEFSTEYPRLSPVSIHQVSERVFQKQFVDHLSEQIARHFHDSFVRDTI